MLDLGLLNMNDASPELPDDRAKQFSCLDATDGFGKKWLRNFGLSATAHPGAKGPSPAQLSSHFAPLLCWVGSRI